MIKHDGSLEFKFSRNLFAFRSSMSLLEIVVRSTKILAQEKKLINNEENKRKDFSVLCLPWSVLGSRDQEI